MTEIKTFTFAVLHIVVAFSVTYAITGSVALGGIIALIEPMCNTIAFYIHEKAWSSVQKRDFRQNRFHFFKIAAQ